MSVNTDRAASASRRIEHVRDSEPENPRLTSRSRFHRDLDWWTPLEHRFRRIIQSRLGEDNVLPQNIRWAYSGILGRAKFSGEPYTGEDDIEVFEAWLNAHTRWLRIRQAVGEEAEPVRKLVLPLGLSGKALAYFNEEIDNVDSRLTWSYEGAVIALMYRFITRRALARASKQFDTVKYTAKEGVLAFYSTLKRIGRQMVEMPGQWAMNQRLLKAIPIDMRLRVLQIDGVRPDLDDTNALVAAIERAELAAADVAEM